MGTVRHGCYTSCYTRVEGAPFVFILRVRGSSSYYQVLNAQVES